jgi:3'-5' exoribonuclease Rv2179c-like domain
MVMNAFVDAEFFEDGSIIDLISIGITLDNGMEFYAVNKDFDTQRMLAHPNNVWLMNNVFNSIGHKKVIDEDCGGLVDVVIEDFYMQPKEVIATQLEEFFTPYCGNVELWAYYAAYDHVALAQLWGRMLDMPTHVLPMYTNDIMTLSAQKGHPKLPPQVAGNHNALFDARHNKVIYNYLVGL